MKKAFENYFLLKKTEELSKYLNEKRKRSSSEDTIENINYFPTELYIDRDIKITNGNVDMIGVEKSRIESIPLNDDIKMVNTNTSASATLDGDNSNVPTVSENENEHEYEIEIEISSTIAEGLISQKDFDDSLENLKVDKNSNEVTKIREISRRSASPLSLPIEKKPKRVTENHKFYYWIYFNVEDSSTEYKMTKIQFNYTEYRLMLDQLPEKVICHGFYGNLNSSLSLVENFLNKKIDYDSIENKEEGIVGFMHENKLALYYKTDLNIFLIKNGPADSNNLAVVYIRYLIDLCQNIFISPGETIITNHDMTSPFTEHCHPIIDLQEQFNEHLEKINLMRIPIVESKSATSMSDFEEKIYLFNDFSKFIYLVYPSYEKKEEEILFDFNHSNDNRNLSYYKRRMSYEEIKSEMKRWSLSHIIDKFSSNKFEKEVKSIYEKLGLESHIIKSITESLQADLTESFCTLDKDRENQLLNISNEFHLKLCEFLKNNVCDVAQSHFQDLHNEGEKTDEEVEVIYDKDEKNEKIQTISETIKDCMVNLSSSLGITRTSSGNLPENKVKILTCDKSNCTRLSDLKSQIECKYKYLNVGFLIDNVSEKFPQVTFHNYQDGKNRLHEELIKTNQNIFYRSSEIIEQFENKLKELKTRILDSLFELIDPAVSSKKKTTLTSCVIKSQEIHFIRNSKNVVENWTYTKYQIIIEKTFNKQFEGEVELGNIINIGGNWGIIQFLNSKSNKSSFYNITYQGKNVSLTPWINSAGDSNLLVDIKLNVWCIYSNSQSKFNIGKISKSGKLEEGTFINVYKEVIEGGNTIEIIISASFVSSIQSIILINQNFDILEVKYYQRKIYPVLRKENKGDDAGLSKSYIRPSRHPEYAYFNVQSSPDGKNIFFLSKFSLDVYDINWSQIYSFELRENFKSYKIIQDFSDIFLLIITRTAIECFQLQGISTSKSISTQIVGLNENKSLRGVPILDYIFLAFKKFGPHSEFISCPKKSNFYMTTCLHKDDPNLKQTKNYFNDEIKIKNCSFDLIENTGAESFAAVITDPKNIFHFHKNILRHVLISRVPLHVATVENSNLVPLKNGCNVSDQISESLVSDKTTDLIEKLISFINFGVYEDELQSCANTVIVISIVGRQSSGKSYGMNRIFGTRFNVASTRCTDGIWISMVKLVDDPEKSYLIMDCEGLFSTRRNEIEEMKLCLTLAAISDVMILNQDLSFNRYLNILFTNFSKAIGRLKGRKLFRGYLFMLIRDVPENESEGAYTELKYNISQILNNTNGGESFLHKLFGGRMMSQCLSYFDKYIFDKEIENLRKILIATTNTTKIRWESGNDFLDSFKITLAQVLSDDDTDIDIHKLKITCEIVYNECVRMFFTGGSNFKDFLFKETFNIMETNYTVIIMHKDLDFSIDKQNNSDYEKDEFKLDAKMLLLSMFSEKTTYRIVSNHNDFMKSLNRYLEVLLHQRIEKVLDYFIEKTPKDAEYGDEINSNLLKLKSLLDNFVIKLKYCEKTCRKCLRICEEFLHHKGDCKCGTEHICLEVCNFTENCTENKYACILNYGHLGEHKCNKGDHRCGEKCSISDCDFLCNLERSHEMFEHNCKNSHSCKKLCIDTNCTRSCRYDYSVPHEIHICNEKLCGHKCDLCNLPCKIEDHLHHLHIMEGDKVKLSKYKLLTEEGASLPAEDFIVDYHTCGSKHNCKEICEIEGACQIEYSVIEKIWKNEFGEFNYPYFKPKESKISCKIFIPEFKIKHEERHNCKLTEHRCSEQCFECYSFCNEKFGHEGLHKTNSHRNKEKNVFVSPNEKSQIAITSEGKVRNYKIGESCQPENCSQSCDRKGRAHYHIRECESINNCEEKFNSDVRHSTQRYYPLDHLQFDEWLCSSYWGSLKWEVPCSIAKKIENNLCDFYCGHSSHKEMTPNFCVKNAWHSDKHEFHCTHPRTGNLLDIVFCCDCTGSMSSYLNASKNAVKKIMTEVKECNVKFGFVAYRDHPPQEPTYVTKVQNLTDEINIIKFIDTLTAQGGGDIPEAVMDGLLDSVTKMTWTKDSLRVIFHIADAPPHGKKFFNGTDGFPNGCPCGITIETISNSFKMNNIRYKLLKIGTNVNQMESIFKLNIENMEVGNLDNAVNLVDKVSEIISREMKNEEFDLNKIFKY